MVLSMDRLMERIDESLLMIRSSRIFHDAEWILSSEAKIIALSSAATVFILSVIHIYRHLRLYTMPSIQRYVVRILCTTLIYALASSVALLLGHNAIYAEIVRDMYEAVVIYSFFNVMLEYVGGETDCIYAIENDSPLNLPFPLCFSEAMPRNARYDQIVCALLTDTSFTPFVVNPYDLPSKRGLKLDC